mmetsp:Transcript_25944/g.61695  ORF Transcript_25944/g.61695 Transcript_25944/m.61695 type:complete len:87 (+) Transcript_25944:282-542(+)
MLRLSGVEGRRDEANCLQRGKLGEGVFPSAAWAAQGRGGSTAGPASPLGEGPPLWSPSGAPQAGFAPGCCLRPNSPVTAAAPCPKA